MCHVWPTMCAATTGIFGHTCWPSLRVSVPALEAPLSHLECLCFQSMACASFPATWLCDTRLQHTLSRSLSLSPFLSLSHTHTHTHTLPLSLSLTRTHAHTHTHTCTRSSWLQILCNIGGIPLLMCINNNGNSCLYAAARQGHADVAEVGAGGGRQREAGGRVSAATAHGTWCRGCRQHTATRGTTLQHTAARCCSVRSS